jgi:ligand-binding sensor domain-containing protein
MKSLLILLASLLCIAARAQEFHFRQINADYGRDVRRITSMFQATGQLIWIGTDQGLYSYDGWTFRYHWRKDKVKSAVSSIAECPAGEIWIGYHDGYVEIMDDEGGASGAILDSLQGVKISRILYDDHGTVFITTYGRGLWKIHESKIERVRFREMSHINDIYDALIDHSGKLWLGTDHGIWIYESGEVQNLSLLDQADGLPDDIVTLLQKENNGDIWIGFYEHGLSRYISGRDSIQHVFSIATQEGHPVDLVEGPGNEIWLATEKSVWRYSPGQQPEKIILPVELKDRIEAILFDQTGNLWLAAGNKLFITSTQWEWIDPGVDNIQAVSGTPTRLWLGCEQGLYEYDLSTRIVRQHLREKQLNVLTLYKDPLGILWIGTFGQGLYIYDPDTERSLYLDEGNGISNSSILNIDGIKDKVWLATLGGITEIQFDKHPFQSPLQIILFQEKFDFPPEYVYDVYAAGEKEVWFGTDGKGLFSFDGQKLKLVTQSFQVFHGDSFDLRTIYSITGDHTGQIWVSTPNGNVLELDRNGRIARHIASPYGSLNSLITTGENEIVMVREGFIQVNNPINGISFFGPSAGLTSFSPNINSTARASDGTVWIADTDRILHYMPLKTDTSRYVHMYMSGVTPGFADESGPIRLKPDSNFLDFRFTGLWYADPASVRYKYMLSGHDKEWIYSNEGRAVYSSLAPGRYTFTVYGSHHDDFTLSRPLVREIVVLPPFYLTWWFLAGTISLIGFLVYKYFRDRINRLQRYHQLEKEKTTSQLNAIHAQVNPHFLFNSFNTLSGIIEEDQEAAVDYVDQLSSFFRGVLQHRDAELITLAEEVEIMRNYLYILEKRHGDNIRIIENITSLEGFVAPLTLQLLVENAIKHNIVSRDKPLTIRITIDDQWLTVSNPIQVKFQSPSESTGFGLSSLTARYDYLTARKIEITRDRNIFTVRIPNIRLNTTA